MPIVESSIEIDLPREKVFILTQDYYVRLEWDPFLHDIKFVGDAKRAAVGVRVWVKAWTGLKMEVEYVTVNEPEVVAVKMVKGPLFFENFAGAWRFNELSKNRTEVVFRYSFTTHWRKLRPILDPIIRRVFGRDLKARLLALKRAAEETDILKHVGTSNSAYLHK